MSAASANTHSDDRLGTFLSDMVFFIHPSSLTVTPTGTQRKGILPGDGQGRTLKGQVHLLGSHHGITAELAQTDQLKTLQKTLKKQKHDLLKKINETIFKFMQIEEGRKW